MMNDKETYLDWSMRAQCFGTSISENVSHVRLMESINSKCITRYFKGWIQSPITPSIAVIIPLETKILIHKNIMKRLSNKNNPYVYK